jgi:hypothetical protein
MNIVEETSEEPSRLLAGAAPRVAKRLYGMVSDLIASG